MSEAVVISNANFQEYRERRRGVMAGSTLSEALQSVKHTIYEDPVTHKFALVRLPERFLEGDPVPVSPTDRWFDTRDEARATVSDLLNLDV